MSDNSILLILGDEHVGPFASVWSAASSEAPATRAMPQQCASTSRNVAIELTLQLARTAIGTRDYAWITDANGLVRSPAYLRGYAKAIGL